MIEIFPNLYVGDQFDEIDVRGRIVAGQNWFVIHAAKEPYHRQALGYTGRGAPKDDPEYLAADRPGRLILNLVDVPDPKYIDVGLMDGAILTIHTKIESHKVLVHCNQGLSRSPTIALLYLHRFAPDWRELTYEAAVEKFKAIYPQYAPAAGMAGYAKEHW